MVHPDFTWQYKIITIKAALHLLALIILATFTSAYSFLSSPHPPLTPTPPPPPSPHHSAVVFTLVNQRDRLLSDLIVGPSRIFEAVTPVLNQFEKFVNQISRVQPKPYYVMTNEDNEQIVLVTGGAGYIGSHTVLELVEVGYKVVVIDNLDNSSEESLKRVGEITGKSENIIFRKIDLLNESLLKELFDEFSFFACIHFAGLKAVGESVREPLRYYHNNLTGTLHLLNLLSINGCKNFVFSSSATVYGTVKTMPVTEDVDIGATNPYGRTKLFIEEFLRDLHKSDPTWNILILRYFNPVGAHSSGRIGEDPSGIPNNLMPYIAQVAVGRREFLSVYGTDYPTPDGTGVRDYIHVVDLAKGHLAALKKLDADPGCVAVNLGTGKGYSVLDMLNGMSKACGRELPYKVAARREGDVAELYADPKFAEVFLEWTAKLGVEEMCADTWRWQSQNPTGYESTTPNAKQANGEAESSPAAVVES